MNQPDASAAPSTAPELVIPTSGKDYDSWRKTGSLEAPAPPKDEAAPAPAEKKTDIEDPSAADDPAETAPAPEADKAQEHRPERRKPDAEHRIKQLLADNKRLQEQLASASPAQPQTKPAEPSPAKAELEAPKEPTEAEYDGSPGKTYEDFRKAERKYYSDLAEYKADQRLQRYQQEQAQQAARTEMSKKLEEAGKRYPDAKEKIVPTATAIHDNPAINGVIKAMINRSDVMPDLLYTLSGELDAFVELAKSDPAAALEKVVVTQHLIREELTGKAKTAETGTDAQRDASGKFVKHDAPEKKVTGAPPPPREVSGKSPPPGDEVQSAVEQGDFANYRRSANSRDLAKKR